MNCSHTGEGQISVVVHVHLVGSNASDNILAILALPWGACEPSQDCLGRCSLDFRSGFCVVVDSCRSNVCLTKIAQECLFMLKRAMYDFKC